MEAGPRDRPLVVDVDVAVQVVARPEGAQKPAVRLEAPVRSVGLVMDVAGRGVGHQDVQVAAVAQPVHHELRQHRGDLCLHPGLGVLVRAGFVAQRAVEPADEQALLHDHASVQLFHAPIGLAFAVAVAHELAVVVAVDAVDRRVEHAGDVVQVVGREVAAAQDQIDLAAALHDARAVEARIDLVADGEDADRASTWRVVVVSLGAVIGGDRSLRQGRRNVYRHRQNVLVG